MNKPDPKHPKRTRFYYASGPEQTEYFLLSGAAGAVGLTLRQRPTGPSYWEGEKVLYYALANDGPINFSKHIQQADVIAAVQALALGKESLWNYLSTLYDRTYEVFDYADINS